MISTTVSMGIPLQQDTHLDYLIPGEREERNVSRIAGHQITIEHTEDTLVRNDKQIVLLPFQFENYRFESHGNVVI